MVVAQRWGNIGPTLIRNLSRRKIGSGDEGVTQPVYGFGSTESSFLSVLLRYMNVYVFGYHAI